MRDYFGDVAFVHNKSTKYVDLAQTKVKFASELPCSFSHHGDVASAREYDVSGNIMIANPGYIIQSEKISPSRVVFGCLTMSALRRRRSGRHHSFTSTIRVPRGSCLGWARCRQPLERRLSAQ